MEEHLGYERSKRSIFPLETTLLKELYLTTQIATKKWAIPLEIMVKSMMNYQ